MACLAPEELSLWVHGLLDCYETKGLRGAQLFMEDVAEHFLRQIRGQGGLRLAASVPACRPMSAGWPAGNCPWSRPRLRPRTASPSSCRPRSACTLTRNGISCFQADRLIPVGLSAHAGMFAAPPGFSIEREEGPSARAVLFHLRPSGPGPLGLCHFLKPRVLAVLKKELPGLMRQAEPLLGQLTLSADDSQS